MFEAYKVVVRLNGELYSIGAYYQRTIDKDYIIHYIPNQVVKPKYGLILVFKALENAICFIEGGILGKFEIWKCEVDALAAIPYLFAMPLTSSSVKAFWQGKCNIYEQAYPPTGTRGCNSLVLTELVKKVSNKG